MFREVGYTGIESVRHYRSILIWMTVAALGQWIWESPAVGADVDWPTWRGDAARSGSTAQELAVPLQLHWTRHLPQPRPAWPDEQGKVRFDASYEPVVARGKVFVPCSADDTLTALDLADGQVVWRYFSAGPVRFAPVVHGDRLMFVSDDGYLTCLQADSGAVLWRRRGGPDDRKVLGNDRLVSMWPARGAPVVLDQTVYWAAGIWPFMGIFVEAVDIASGNVVWTNSGSGSEYIVQQHNSPAFAGVAPQGYLVANDQYLLVSGGMTVPAVFRRTTGKLLYYRPGDRELGKDVGGYEVLLGPDWFSTRGRLHMLADGEPRAEAPVDLIGPDAIWGVAGKHIVVSQTHIEQYVETSVDKKGQETRTTKYRLPEQFRVRLPEGLSRLHARVANGLLATDDNGRVALLEMPRPNVEPLPIQWETTVDGKLWALVIADGRLLTVDLSGTIRCYGPPRPLASEPIEYRESDATDRPVPSATPESTSDMMLSLEMTTARDGYAVLDQPRSVEELWPWIQQTRFHLLALVKDEQQVGVFRKQLHDQGILASRVAVVHGDVRSARLPPYLAEVVVTSNAQIPEESLQDSPRSYLESLFAALRPYSGLAVIKCPPEKSAVYKSLFGTYQPQATVDGTDSRLYVRRTVPPPGSGTWTSQNGDAGNTLVSQETNVKTPMGVLWFGGPPNRGVLPRHGHGPTPQVIGGRLFIEGRDMLRAVDVYTGRLLWQREFKDVGLFYDDTEHRPGANAIGGNYVCTLDSVYLVWGRRCLRLDPATGATLAEFHLPPDESGPEPYWGYVGVWGDYLIAGSAPMLLYALAPGEKKDDDDKEQLKREVPLFSQFGEGSRRLVIMNRLTGAVQWTRDAQFNFRHNAIAMGNGKLFCLDRMTEQRLAHYRRRGVVPTANFVLYALDLRDGHVLWQSADCAFGTWLAYNEVNGRLLQGGSKNSDRAADEVGVGLALLDGDTGALLWRNEDDYGGPPLFYPRDIVTQGTAYDLATGQRKSRQHPLTGEPLAWKFTRNYGCNTAIGCLNLLTFRSAAAGFFDLTHDGGTGNWGGFRSSCTSNLIAADGVLNAPDYTRTCTCSYQNQCSLALIHMPDVETWTFNSVRSSPERIQNLGINFGAPGDRRADNGTLWLDFPSVGGPSPDVPLAIYGEALTYAREHALCVGTQRMPWVFASGVRGARRITVRLADTSAADSPPQRYSVRLYWRCDAGVQLQSLVASAVRVEGAVGPCACEEVTTRDSATNDPATDCLVQQWREVSVKNQLEIDVSPISDPLLKSPQDRPLLCGIEIIAE